MELRNKRIKFGVAALIACAVLLIGATLAYFTDRATASATGVAGTVKIALDDTMTLPTNFNPGDGRLLAATITNEGNKSVDVRQTFQVTMTPAAGVTDFTAGPDTMGWALYAKSDCTTDTAGNWVPKAATSPITPTSTSTNAGVITALYAIPEVTLNGTGTDAEIEDPIDTNIADSEYVLVMLPGSDNSYQAATVTVDILAEAKQHRNTDSSTWASLEKASVTFGGAAVVPARDEDTNLATIQ